MDIYMQTVAATQSNPANLLIALTEEESHEVRTRIAGTVMRVIAPILVDGCAGPGGTIYSKILNELVQRHLRSVAFSRMRMENNYYRGTIVINQRDIFYWGKPNVDSMWHDGV